MTDSLTRREHTFAMYIPVAGRFPSNFARRVCGFTEATSAPRRRTELPGPTATMVVSFGDPYEISEPGVARGRRYPNGFFAGLSAGHVNSEIVGTAHCIQIDLTPLAASRLTGTPLGEFAGEVAALEDVFGRLSIFELNERLAPAATWKERFGILHGFLLERDRTSYGPVPEIARCWAMLEGSAGTIPIGELASETGWSRKHLIARFREHVGVTPKLLARLMRFQRAVEMIESQSRPCWSDIAYACGFSDQSHLIRDLKAFTGITPVELWRYRRPLTPAG